MPRAQLLSPRLTRRRRRRSSGASPGPANRGGADHDVEKHDQQADHPEHVRAAGGRRHGRDRGSGCPAAVGGDDRGDDRHERHESARRRACATPVASVPVSGADARFPPGERISGRRSWCRGRRSSGRTSRATRGTRSSAGTSSRGSATGVATSVCITPGGETAGSAAPGAADPGAGDGDSASLVGAVGILAIPVMGRTAGSPVVTTRGRRTRRSRPPRRSGGSRRGPL